MTVMRYAGISKLLLLSVSCIAGVAAVRTWVRPLGESEGQLAFLSTTRSWILDNEQDPDTLLRMTADVVERDPFRLSRRPSAVRFSMSNEPVEHLPRPQRPQVVVSGVVGGPPWIAVLTGLPSRDGPVVVRPGDVFGSLVIKSIARELVVVSAPDTVWRLAVRRP
jgi:hypothetical protein